MNSKVLYHVCIIAEIVSDIDKFGGVEVKLGTEESAALIAGNKLLGSSSIMTKLGVMMDEGSVRFGPEERGDISRMRMSLMNSI